MKEGWRKKGRKEGRKEGGREGGREEEVRKAFLCSHSFESVYQ